MKKAIALGLAVVMSFAALTACGSKAPESTAPESEASVAEESEAAAPETEAEVESEAAESEAEGDTATAAGTGDVVKASKDYKIACMVKDSSSAFWRYLVAGAMAAGDDLGVTVVEYAPMEAQSLAEQTQEVEDAIQAGVDAICIASVDSAGIVPALQKANDAGIPVIAVNTRAGEGAKVETFVGIDNEAAAENIAEWLMGELGGEGNVFIIEGNPAGQTSVDRLAGFTAVIEKNEGITQLTSQPSYFKRDEAMTIMENQIQKDSDIQAVIGMNDDIGLGAWQALDDAGLADGIIITGFDGAVEGCSAILEGKLKATMDQDALGTGYQGVLAAVTVLEGGSVDEWIKIGGTVIDENNAQAYLDNFAAYGFTE